MIKKSIFAPLAAAAVLVASAGPAFAKTQEHQEVATGGSASKDSAERKSCKRYDRVDSRLRSEMYCFTRSDWKKVEAVY